MEFFSFSGKGQRKTNEDYYISLQFDENTSLHIVADGMGGYSHGDLAARTATEAIVECFSSRYQDQDTELLIEESLKSANEQILQKQKELRTKLGTTIAGVFIQRHSAYVFWLGDVQIYHFRNKGLIFVSESHSLVNEIKKNEVLLSKDIERYSHIVTKSLSGNELTNISITKLQWEKDDAICICSDGFYREYDVDKLISLSVKERLELLEGNAQIPEDNHTVILITLETES